MTQFGKIPRRGRSSLLEGVDDQARTQRQRTRRPSGARLARWLAVSIAAAFVAAVLPSVAGATDYCVNTSCGGTNVASFEQALDQADNAADADRIFLGAGTYTAPVANGFRYDRADAPVEIVGQGKGQTILTSPTGGTSWVLRLVGGAGSSVHDLTIRLPQNAAGGLTGLFTKNAARRIEVVEDPTQSNSRRGVDLQQGGTLEDSSVTLGSAQHTTAVLLSTGGGAVRRSLLSGRAGVDSAYGGAIERSLVTASSTGVDASRNVTAIAASVIRITGTGGSGIWAAPQATSHPTVSADGVTIVGPGLPDTYGVWADTLVYPAQSADISLTNSIIRGVSTPLRAFAAGAGQAQVAASYSDYDPSGNVVTGANAGITAANVSNVGDAPFVDPAGGDYRLLPDSPLIDMGDPATAPGLDLDGNPLVADGDGDAAARRDLGAYELQPAASPPPTPPPPPTPTPPPPAPVDRTAPTLSGLTVTPKLITRGSALPTLTNNTHKSRIELSMSERAKLAFRFKRRVAGAWKPVRGRIDVPASRVNAGRLRLRFAGRLSASRRLRPGSYRVEVVATDLAGNRSKTAAARFRLRR